MSTAATSRGNLTNAGKGRVEGVPNKLTVSARRCVEGFLERNVERVQTLWDSVAAKDPEQALKLWIKIAALIVRPAAIVGGDVTNNVSLAASVSIGNSPALDAGQLTHAALMRMSTDDVLKLATAGKLDGDAILAVLADQGAQPVIEHRGAPEPVCGGISAPGTRNDGALDADVGPAGGGP